jgi:serine/threonine protein kinase
VKPANILLELGVDRVMLTDFGLARAIDDASITRTGLIAGTPQYMSPEQVRGDPLDARSDLFSLGSVLYAMATGRPPFRAETSYGILRRVTDSEPRPAREINEDTPAWLAKIIGKLLSKAPADRFASAQAVATLLEQCLAHVHQPTAVPLPEFCRTPRRRRWLTAAGIALGCALAALAATYPLWPDGRDHRGVPPPDSKIAQTRSDNSAREVSEVKPEISDAWDAIAEQLDVLGRDSQAFESRNAHPWDRLPVSLSEDAGTKTDSNSEFRPEREP